MSSMWRAMARAVLVSSLGVIVALATTASAETCPAGCGLQKRACIATARTAKISCKLDCRSGGSADLGSCMRTCIAGFLDAKDACRSDHTACLDTCSPPTPPPPGDGCLADCGTDLAACARGVVADGRTCLAGCRTASDHRQCLADCAAAAQEGAAACAGSFRTCVAGCGGGSPSGAFL